MPITAIDPEDLPLARESRCSRDQDIELSIRETLSGFYDPTIEEKWWQDQSDALLQRGYKLRRRFRKDWTPSWLGRDFHPDYCEDRLFRVNIRILDAIRICDGLRVCMKKVRGSGHEAHMLSIFNEPRIRDHPHNHCVPILDFFPSKDSDISLLVMPYLCRFNVPPFESVDEVADFMQQALEGLRFLHCNRVAHHARDLGEGNIMMDAENLYPHGHHPSLPTMDMHALGPAEVLRRRDVASERAIKYYFIDFEVTRRFEDPNVEPRVLLRFGQDQELPELSFKQPYDPFKVDVFMLGNVFRRKLCQNHPNLSFLDPLVSSMTKRNPDERPTVCEALELFHTLIKKQSRFSLRNRLRRWGESPQERLWYDAVFFIVEETVVPILRSPFTEPAILLLVLAIAASFIPQPDGPISCILKVMRRSLAV